MQTWGFDLFSLAKNYNSVKFIFIIRSFNLLDWNQVIFALVNAFERNIQTKCCHKLTFNDNVWNFTVN